MLNLIKQQQPDQENLDQPVIKVCGRKPQAEKQSLKQELQQLIAATPGYEDSSEEEVTAISDGLLEFASIAYSIFLKDYPLAAEQEDLDGYPSREDPVIFKRADQLLDISTFSTTKPTSTKSKSTKSKNTL